MSHEAEHAEAAVIVRAIAEILPEEISGKDAVTAMRDGGSTQWRQMEWPGFWLEWMCEIGVLPRIGGTAGPLVHRTRFDIRLDGVWDLKVHTNGKKVAILNDCDAVEHCIATHGGIGFIIVSGDMAMDEDGSFKAWHDELKGKPSAYVLAGRRNGRRSRPRKDTFSPTRVSAYHFSSMDQLRRAVSAGWMKDSFQAGLPNSNDGERRSKYSLVVKAVPEDAAVAWTDL